jgi:prephenate dehydrogenase
MALKAAKVDATIVGTDEKYTEATKAQRRGAFDKVERRLMNATDGADIVVLAMPVSGMKEIMEVIGPGLKEGTVVTDTGATKEVVLSWAQQYLPSNVHFVGGHPLVWPAGSGPEYAMPDLFKDQVYCIVPARWASEEAVRKVMRIVEWIGAKPFHLNADEHDSYAAGVSQLPAVLAAALVKCTSNSPSWVDISKLVEPTFSTFTVMASGTPEVNRDICLTNTAKTIGWIERFIGELLEVREMLQGEQDKAEKSLHDLFDKAQEERLRWMAGKVTREFAPAVSVPTFGEMALELVIPRFLIEKYKRGMKMGEQKEQQK